MLDFQPWTIFFTIVNLLILYFFFRKLLFGRINAVLEQREQLIRSQVEEAEKSNADAQQTAAEAEARIAAERSEMLRAARGEVANLAVMAATEVAGKRLDTDSDRALAEEFLAKVGEQA